ncbi:hypothetical protein ACPXB3_09650 [Gordonia sp. DT219]|uniref:hypothetical protein n=1 Tax=Gordonia sp. DT219 TaxID=3416658 RepID=UPI003CED5A40
MSTAVDDVYLRVRAITGFDAAAIPVPGSRIVVAGVVGDAVDELLTVCADTAPDLSVSGFGGAGAGGMEAGGIGAGVMVLDPSSDIDDEDVALFTRLRTQVGTVALVCVGIDAFWEWPRRLRAARAVLDPAEDVPVFAVSAAAAMAGELDESGIGDLVGWMRACGTGPAGLRAERARLGACLTALDHLATPGHPAPDRRGPDELMRRRRILVATRDRGRTDRLAAVRAGVSGVRSATIADVQAGFRALAAAANRRCADAGGSEPDAHGRWLEAEVGRIAERVDAVTDERLEEVAATTLLGVDMAEPAPVSVSADSSSPPLIRRATPSGRRGAEDALLVLFGASTGVGIGRLAVAPMASVHTLQWVSMPLTLLVGVAAAIWVIRLRRATVRRADLRAYSTDVLAEARGRLEQRVAARTAEAQSRLAGQIDRHHERRMRQVAADVAEIDERLRRLRSPRSAGGATDHERVQQLRALISASLHENVGRVQERGEVRDGSVCAG